MYDMFKVVCDIMTHSYEMWNVIIAINFCIAKKMDCALMIIISNHFGIKCLFYELQLDTWYVILKVFSDMLAHRYEWEIHYLLQFISA